jgi:protein-tyrosine-phosphatase/DNA-binding HxlR family transcriptional regulator
MPNERPSTVDRARVHAALGDPSRLTIVDMLMLGDAAPGEIGDVLGMPTNLVAHHLKVLTEAGLVVRTRSQGDHRRAYVRLVHETIAGLSAPTTRAADRVVFVCSHNSARSQLAAALWATCSTVPTASAGTEPAKRIHPRTIRTARRHRLTLLAGATANLSDVLRRGDLVVAVCDNAHESLPSDRTRLHWSVPDPAVADTDLAFESAFNDLAARVDRLAPMVGSRSRRLRGDGPVGGRQTG